MNHWNAKTLLLTGLIGLTISRSVGADSAPAVHFDASPIVACADVTTPEFRSKHPTEKLVQVRIAVSLLVTCGESGQLAEASYFAQAVERKAQVWDFSPKTQLATDVVGNITVQQNRSQNDGIQLNGGGRLDTMVHGEASFSNSKQGHSAESYERLPEQQIVTTAATTGRGSGVYFKQRANPQTSLEGTHLLTIVLRVPQDWRTDYLRLVCRAHRRNSSTRHDGNTITTLYFLVPLFLDSDAEAQQLAAHLLASEHELLAVSRRHSHAIHKRRFPTLAHELALVEPEIPGNWLNLILWQSATASTRPFEGQLPEDVQQAITNYGVAKRAVRGQSGGWPSAEDVMSPQPETESMTVAKPILPEVDRTPSGSGRLGNDAGQG